MIRLMLRRGLVLPQGMLIVDHVDQAWSRARNLCQEMVSYPRECRIYIQDVYSMKLLRMQDLLPVVFRITVGFV